MKTVQFLGSMALGLSLWAASPQSAEACGGFFCSSTPVDQNAERIIFKVRPDGRTDMIVQIAYQGDPSNFAWLMPLAEPPAKEDLGTFPLLAMTALDGQTGPVISDSCGRAGFLVPAAVNDNSGDEFGGGGVQVYLQEQVGNYEVAVIGSESASASSQWLRDNGYRISEPMDGFIQLYTKEQMKFLALKLLPEKSVSDITPFKLTLPGTAPSIPLRMTAIAAEPEMGIVSWVFANQRYAPANATELKIDDTKLLFDPFTAQSNWTAQVARAVDEANGRGWVVEEAEPIQNLRDFAQTSFTSDPMQAEARDALLALFADVTYMTRLYTRLSPEEMTYDPVFRSSDLGDVSRFRTVGELDAGCGTFDPNPPQPSPCEFSACGALGLCREVALDDAANTKVAACACAPGFTARAAVTPSLSSSDTPASVSCIDQQISFLNPGDKNESGEVLPDPCTGFDCGEHGKCVPMNMTPTCECEQDYVARGSFEADGTRITRCEKPLKAIPKEFYNRRPMKRDDSLPIGRRVLVPIVQGPSDDQDPLPQGNSVARANKKSDSCSVQQAPGARASLSSFALLGLIGALVARRRTR